MESILALVLLEESLIIACGQKHISGGGLRINYLCPCLDNIICKLLCGSDGVNLPVLKLACVGCDSVVYSCFIVILGNEDKECYVVVVYHCLECDDLVSGNA